ncbi:MAG TPA: HDOD domain-containing protein [Opitutaceae bacterium]|nr:HDOD domain-containing protein [Opitutaceae bacterium]
MANVLLIDENEVARKALRGILARGGHRFAAVGKPDEAWEFVRREVKVDVVFMEFALEDPRGPEFVRRMRADCLLKHLPVVIYATPSNRAAVRAGLELRVQNFLLKPYLEEQVFAEMAKATAQPWRQRHFEEEKSFCVLMGMQPADLHRLLQDLQLSLARAEAELGAAAEGADGPRADACLASLAAAAEAAGAWGPYERVQELQPLAAARDWKGLQAALPGLAVAASLISIHLHPGALPAAFLTEAERQADEEAREKARWFEAVAQERCPVVPAKEAIRRVEALRGCPIVDTAAAMFQMLATGHPSSLIPILERVETDPGLAAQVLIAANHLQRHQEEDATPIDDLKLAVELMGELKLAEMGRALVTFEERKLHAPPFTWTRFWMFQIAVARMARSTAAYLEFHSLESQAYVGGLLHDLGKLLLAHQFPFGWQAMLAYARDRGVSTAAAERVFIGCTARELADRFARTHALPACYRHVMRYLEAPDEAEGDQELVALVALARDLCRRNHLGSDGDQPRDNGRTMVQTRAWEVLAPKVFPGFDLAAFESRMHVVCQELKRELHGWREAPAL